MGVGVEVCVWRCVGGWVLCRCGGVGVEMWVWRCGCCVGVGVMPM